MTISKIPVAIVGAGPVGLACALRLASFGIRSVVLEADPRLRAEGSKACCIQGDVVEILDKIGVAEHIVAEGVPWRIGRTYVRGRELFTVEYPRNGRFPAWVNLSQYRTQQIMMECLRAGGVAEVRWSHRVTGVSQDGDGVTVGVSTPDGPRTVRVDYLVACDGIHSEVRKVLGVAWTGYRHGDRFLIADIRADIRLAHERHFHYDPPFSPARQLVMHAQPDNVWRIDWQLAPDADIEAEQRNGQLDRRIRDVIGDIPYEVRWWSTYRFNQRVVTRMRVGRVLFAGDAAHALPPYGARGMNSGIQDIDNLAWKLHLVLTRRATDTLLETYHTERHAAALENLRVTEKTIKFMVPSTRTRRLARDALLKVAPVIRPLRRRVDSGRMAEPFVYTDSRIVDRGDGNPLVGAFAPDGSLQAAGERLRLRELFGSEFVGVYFGTDPRAAGRFAEQALASLPDGVPFRLVLVLPQGVRLPDVGHLGSAARVVHDDGPGLRQAYRAERACWYLVRPDGHVAAAGGPSVGDAAEADASTPEQGSDGDAAALAAALLRGVAGPSPDSVPVGP